MNRSKTIPIVNISVGVRTHGLRAGKLSVFIETYNPNVVNPLVHMQSDNYVELTLAQIAGRIEMEGQGCRDISIIGPEPLFTKNIDELLQFLDMKNFIVEVDTYGNVPIADHRVQRTSSIKVLNRLQKSSNIHFLLYYASGNNLYQSELPNLSSDDTLICRIRSQSDLEDCIAIAKSIDSGHICFAPVAELISPEIVIERIVKEQLWRVKYQPTLTDVLTYISQK